ncbi:MAG TPA: hypothetical protein VMP01_07730 [Pirellulaceae bacterium]|nr:hypothetical protein [Pirellulaceae bacterium]
MDTIRFQTTVGPDQLIHIPQGIVLPPGPVEVTIVACMPAAEPPKGTSGKLRSFLLELAEDAERQNPELPTDMAEHHDFYAHGKPRE